MRCVCGVVCGVGLFGILDDAVLGYGYGGGLGHGLDLLGLDRRLPVVVLEFGLGSSALGLLLHVVCFAGHLRQKMVGAVHVDDQVTREGSRAVNGDCGGDWNVPGMEE